MSASANSAAFADADARRRTCVQCGMVCDQEGEFHPYLFCLLVAARRDPWEEVLRLNEQLGLVKPSEMPRRTPLVRDLPMSREGGS